MRQSCCYCKAKMATSKMFSFRQLHLLIPSTCWNVAQRNYIRERTLMKNLGYPEKPKRPSTAFVKFCSCKRASVLEQNPNVSFTEITRILSKHWKALPGAEKQKYNDEYRKELADYKEKLEEYNRSLTDQQKQEMKDLKTEYNASKKENSLKMDVKKMEKKLKKPKNPVSPFIVFCTITASSYEGLNGVERVRKSAEKWKNLSETEKQKYKDIFNKDFEQFKKDLKKWEEQMMQQGNLELVRLGTLKKKLQSSK